jgi:tetratricopeptide (TPR) repeat protein
MRLKVLSLAAIVLVSPAAHGDVDVRHGVGAGGDIEVGGDINIGLTPIQVSALMQQILAEQGAGVAKVEELSGRLSVTTAAIATFFQVLGRQNVPIEQLPATLVEIAQRHRGLLEQIGSIPSQSPAVQALKDRARSAVEEGDYQRAEVLLAEAEDAALAAARRLREEADRQFLDAAATRAERGELSLTQLDYAGAAAHFRSAAEMVPDTSPLVRADYLNRYGLAAHEAGDYATAEAVYGDVLRLRAQHLRYDDLQIGTSLNNLAGLYHNQGRYAEAEPAYELALRIIEAALGPDDPQVGATLHNLAALYRAQGRYDRAEPLHQRALTIRESALGPDDPLVGQSLNSLAVLYHTQERYDRAEPLYQRALAISEASLGADHPDVAVRLGNLALLYKALGRYDQARPLYERALRIFEAALGTEHPHVGTMLNNLAGLHKDEGRYDEAEPLYRRAVAVAEAAFGPDHPDVAISLNNLALLYEALGRYAEAEAPYRRMLDILSERCRPITLTWGWAQRTMPACCASSGATTRPPGGRRKPRRFGKRAKPARPPIDSLAASAGPRGALCRWRESRRRGVRCGEGNSAG